MRYLWDCEFPSRFVFITMATALTSVGACAQRFSSWDAQKWVRIVGLFSGVSEIFRILLLHGRPWNMTAMHLRPNIDSLRNWSRPRAQAKWDMLPDRSLDQWWNRDHGQVRNHL